VFPATECPSKSPFASDAPQAQPLKILLPADLSSELIDYQPIRIRTMLVSIWFPDFQPPSQKGNGDTIFIYKPAFQHLNPVRFSSPNHNHLLQSISLLSITMSSGEPTYVRSSSARRCRHHPYFIFCSKTSGQFHSAKGNMVEAVIMLLIECLNVD
jgi:hypothetical protein